MCVCRCAWLSTSLHYSSVDIIFAHSDAQEASLIISLHTRLLFNWCQVGVWGIITFTAVPSHTSTHSTWHLFSQFGCHYTRMSVCGCLFLYSAAALVGRVPPSTLPALALLRPAYQSQSHAHIHLLASFKVQTVCSSLDLCLNLQTTAVHRNLLEMY